MTEKESDPGMAELEFLMNRYDQLIETQSNINEIIHTTFHISVVVFGILLGAIPLLSDAVARASLYLFAAFIFVAMYGWTKTYLNSREETEAHLGTVVGEFEKIEPAFEQIQPADAYFSEPADYRKEQWEETKETLLQYYYLGLAVLAVLILIIDIVFRPLDGVIPF